MIEREVLLMVNVEAPHVGIPGQTGLRPDAVTDVYIGSRHIKTKRLEFRQPVRECGGTEIALVMDEFSPCDVALSMLSKAQHRHVPVLLDNADGSSIYYDADALFWLDEGELFHERGAMWMLTMRLHPVQWLTEPPEPLPAIPPPPPSVLFRKLWVVK